MDEVNKPSERRNGIFQNMMRYCMRLTQSESVSACSDQFFFATLDPLQHSWPEINCLHFHTKLELDFEPGTISWLRSLIIKQGVSTAN